MNAELGVFLLLLSLITASYAVIAAQVGVRRGRDALIVSARNALFLTWPLLTAACLLLIYLLVTHDFNTSFVWSVTNRSMPLYLRVTALWGGQAGSLVFWSWLMSSFMAGAVVFNWQSHRRLMPGVITVAGATLIFFLVMVTFWENPFARYWQTPAGEIYAALFSPSRLLAGISQAIQAGKDLPGLLGVLLGGIMPLAAPAGSQMVFPNDGEGMSVLLRHPGMIIHPPMLYLGFVGFTIPFAFGMAALAQGDVKEDTWMRASRRWTLVAWLFLSLGLVLGGWWAYDVLGWGGYWAWDPVENAALMPWLTGTAMLHSVMIQEKQGMLRRWNIVLVILTYLLVVLGTFATRSGFVSSVHSFAQSAIGPLFFIFLAGALIASVYLLVRRWDELGDDRRLDGLLSRETAFLVNNMLFVSIMVTVGIGTYWPVFTELLSTFTAVEKSSVDPSFFEATTGPQFIALLILMGIAPLLAWRKASAERLGKAVLWPSLVTVVIVALLAIFGVRNPWALAGIFVALWTGLITLWEYVRAVQARVRSHNENPAAALWQLFGRNRRRYGGYMIHLGVVVMAIGIIGSSIYQQETQRTLRAGQQITLGDYVLEYTTLERFVATDGRSVIRGVTTVYRDGREVAELKPRLDFYTNGERASIPAAVMSPLGDDFYVLLVTWEPVNMSSATFKVYFNPLVNWIWTGSFVFILGTLIAAWPFEQEQRKAAAVRRGALNPAAGD